MQCPRLTHFRRIMPSGNVGVCGHMIQARQFSSLSELESSQWLADLKSQMSADIWPSECRRCQDTEAATQSSVRLDTLKRHDLLSAQRSDYLIIGGVLDNLCNSACQTCNATLSTKIGSLHDRYNYVIHDNSDAFAQLPSERIIQLDINGGEPSYSKNYQRLLENLPANLRYLRVNTNGSRPLPNLQRILDQGIQVTITLSFDGTGQVHDYVRWPITWDKFHQTVHSYLSLREQNSSLTIDSWTTVSSLNLQDLPNIVDYTQQHGIGWSYGLLVTPAPLDIRFANQFTIAAKQQLSESSDQTVRLIADITATQADNQDQLMQYIEQQDHLRGIDYRNYLL